MLNRRLYQFSRRERKKLAERSKADRELRKAVEKTVRAIIGAEAHSMWLAVTRLHEPTKVINHRARRMCDGRGKMRLGDFPF